MKETIRDLPVNHRRTYNLRDKVKIWINNITPQYTCTVIRDVSEEVSPRPPTAWADERIYEVRYLEGPFKEQYVNACAWELDPAARLRKASRHPRTNRAPVAQLSGA